MPAYAVIHPQESINPTYHEMYTTEPLVKFIPAPLITSQWKIFYLKRIRDPCNEVVNKMVGSKDRILNLKRFGGGSNQPEEVVFKRNCTINSPPSKVCIPLLQRYRKLLSCKIFNLLNKSTYNVSGPS